MDPMEFYNNEIARCRQVQTEMQAFLETIKDQYKKALPYITEFPDKRIVAQKLYEQASSLMDLMRKNLEYIYRVEQRIILLQAAGNQLWDYEDDVGYSSADNDISADNDVSLDDETLSSDDGHEFSGYESGLEIDLENI